MKMYHRMSEKIVSCDLGCKHLIGIYAVAEWTPTGEEFDWDTGYGISRGMIFEDRFGSRCAAYPTVDNPVYKRVSDNTHWDSRPRPRGAETVSQNIYGELLDIQPYSKVK